MKTIFISSTFRDMHHERDAIKKRIEPQLNDYAGSYGDRILLKDLRWGINTQGMKEDQVEIRVLRSCLEEIDDSRPYMVILLGDRYGTTFKEEQIREEVEGYEGFSEKDLHKSIMGLEIEYGALNPTHWRGKEKPKALFYFRRLEGDFPKDYQDAQEKDEKLLKRLRERIQKTFGPVQVHEYCLEFENKEPKRESLDAFVEKVREDIKALFQAEWKEKEKWSETKRELDRHWDYARQKAEQFQGREHLLQNCCAELEKGTPILAVKGASGTGKSTLLGKLAVDFEKEGRTVVPLFCGTTDRMTTASDVMIFLIDYIAEHLGRPTWKQRVEEHDPMSKQQDPSMRMEETINLSGKQHFDQELTSNTANPLRLQDVFQEYVSLYNGKAKSNTIILVDAIDQLAEDELRDKLSFLRSFFRYEDGKKEEEKKGNQNIDGEGIPCLEEETLSKQSPKLQMILSFLEEERKPPLITSQFSLEVLEIRTLEKEEKRVVLEGILRYLRKELSEQVRSEILKKPSSNNPLYLSLIIRRLLMMDKEDYDHIERSGGGMNGIDLYQSEIVHGLSDQLEGLALDILDSAKEKIGADSSFVERTMDYLCTSRYGVREGDLEKLFEGRGGTWLSADFSLLKQYIRNLFIKRGDGRIDFSHKIIREAMQGRQKEEEKSLHQDLVNFLMQDCSIKDKIRQEELIYHCRGAEDGESFLKHLLEIEGCEGKKIYFEVAGKKLHESVLEDQGTWVVELLDQWKQKEDGEKLFVVMKLVHEYYPKAETEEEKNLFEKILLASIGLGESLQARAGEDTEGYKSLFKELASCYGEMGWFYLEKRSAQAYPKAEEQYRRCLKLQEEVYQELKTAESKNKLATACSNLGDLYQTIGGEENYRKAEEQYRRYLKLQEEVYQELKTAESKDKLATACFNLGYLYQTIGGEENYRKAEEQYRRYLKLREEVYEELRTAESKDKLAISFFNLGYLYQTIGGEENYRKAEEQYRRCLKLQEEVYEELKTSESKDKLATACSKLGYLYQTIGGEENYRKAAEYHKRSLTPYEEIYRKVRTSESKDELAIACSNLGYLYQVIGGEENYREAAEYHKKSLTLYEEIYRKVRTSESKNELATACSNLGYLYATMGGEENSSKAEELFLRSLNLWEELYQELGTSESKDKLATACSNLGDLYETIGGEENYRKAEEQYQRCLTLREKLYQELRTSESKDELATAFFNLGCLYVTMGGEENYGKAEEQYKRSLPLREELYLESETPKNKKELGNICFNLGYLYVTMGGEENYRKAEEHYKRCLKLLEEIYEELRTSKSKEWLATACFNLGDLYLDMDREMYWAKSEVLLQKSLKLREELYKESDESKYKSGIALTCNNLGYLYKEWGGEENYRKAEELFLRSLNLREELYQEVGSEKSKKDMAGSYFRLGDVYLTMGEEENYRKAEELLLRSLDLYQELGEEENEEKISKVRKTLEDLYEAMGGPKKEE